MVSIRRRKLLGLCAGKNTTSVQFSASDENAVAAESPKLNINSDCVHPLPSFIFNEQKQADASTAISTSAKEEPQIQQFPVPGVKRRKKYRRKHVDDQGPCTMRGVYFKNMKWQAAIKVDKKQIHLGTCQSQEEAARLYDRPPCFLALPAACCQLPACPRLPALPKLPACAGPAPAACAACCAALPCLLPCCFSCCAATPCASLQISRMSRAAFMCGREPNFELSEEEKHELRRFKWEEFLAITRNAIRSKKHQRRLGLGHQRKGGIQLRSDWEPEKDIRASSVSDDIDGD